MLDSDNFLLLELSANASQYTILDAGKVEWGGTGAFTWTYDGDPMPMN